MFINVRNTNGHGLFSYTAEVSDANGDFHTMENIYAESMAGAHRAFESIATLWDTIALPTEPAPSYGSADAIAAECAIWGCE